TGDFVVAWGGSVGGEDVRARRFAANEPPTTSGIAPVNVTANAPDTVLNLFAAFDDSTDPDNAMTYSVAGETNPALFSSTTINPAAGTLTLDYAPGQVGQATITVRATDTRGLFTETSFVVSVATPPPVAVTQSVFLFQTAPLRVEVTFDRDVDVSS